MLDVAMLLELRNVNMCLSHGRPPAVISQVYSVAKPLDAALKDVVVDILDIERVLKISDEFLDLTERLNALLARSNIFGTLAQISPTKFAPHKHKDTVVHRLT